MSASPTTPSSSSAAPPALVRGMGLMSATALVMGSMIGSGIFIVSAGIARLVQTPALLLLVWTLSGLMTLAAALSYGELAAAMPQAGGQYVYLREALGPLFGFLYGWTLFIVIQTGTIAAVAIAFAKYAGVVFPWVSGSRWLVHAGRIGSIPIGLNSQELVAVAMIVLLTWLNSRGLKTGTNVQNLFTAAKAAALAALVLIGIGVARNARAVAANFHGFWSGLSLSGRLPYHHAGRVLMVSTPAMILVALVGALFSSDAWNNITFTAGEVNQPRRNLPLALALGTGCVTVLYLLANVAYLNVLPLHGVAAATTVLGRGIQHATEDRVASAMMSALLGSRGALLISLAILVSTFGCNNGLILSGARVYYAMARDGLFFPAAASLNRRGRVPAKALAIQGVWASLLCLSGTYDQLLDYVMFAVFLFYILTIAGLFRLRRTRPEMPRPYRAWGYPWLPGIYLLLATAFDAELLRYKPGYAGGGLILVSLGVPIYYWWRRRFRPLGEVVAGGGREVS